MASETPRVDPTEISNVNAPVFRIIAQIKSQPTESQLILQSPTISSKNGSEIEMITLNNIRVSMNKTFETDSWYEFVCRNNDDGELGFFDSRRCTMQIQGERRFKLKRCGCFTKTM